MIHNQLRRPGTVEKCVAMMPESVLRRGRTGGPKRFILVDTLGLHLAVKVVAASVSEKAGAKFLIIKGMICCRAAGAVANLTGWLWEVVKRSDSLKSFVLLPRRWVVERSFVWLGFHRRLSKDYAKLSRNSESAFCVCMLPMMLRRLN